MINTKAEALERARAIATRCNEFGSATATNDERAVCILAARVLTLEDCLIDTASTLGAALKAFNQERES